MLFEAPTNRLAYERSGGRNENVGQAMHYKDRKRQPRLEVQADIERRVDEHIDRIYDYVEFIAAESVRRRMFQDDAHEQAERDE